MVKITASEMAGIREAVEDTFVELATIQTVTRASDGTGGYTETWSSRTGVPCRLISASNQGRQGLTTGGQWQVASGWALQLRWDDSIAQGDRVVLGGDTYTVLSVDDAHSQRAYRRAFLRRID